MKINKKLLYSFTFVVAVSMGVLAYNFIPKTTTYEVSGIVPLKTETQLIGESTAIVSGKPESVNLAI